MSSFSDPDAVARYAEGPVRLVPGFLHLQRMAMLLLAERVGDSGQVLVLGAGGGLELRVFAEAQPSWHFTGVDPSAEMLALAAKVTQTHSDRITLHHGTIDSAPPGPFDGATGLLVLHFIPQDQRLATMTALRQRLRPGAPLVVAHHSIPEGPERALWLDRFAAFATPSGKPDATFLAGTKRMGADLPILSPDQDEALLRQAGFQDVSLFYAAFTFRGWVATAP